MKLNNFNYPYINIWILVLLCLIVSIWNSVYLEFVVFLVVIKVWHLILDVIEHYRK